MYMPFNVNKKGKITFVRFTPNNILRSKAIKDARKSMKASTKRFQLEVAKLTGKKQ